jgi:hypothetical protein
MRGWEVVRSECLGLDSIDSNRPDVPAGNRTINCDPVDVWQYVIGGKGQPPMQRERASA